MAKRTEDKFANQAYGYATESAAGALTFGEIHTGISIFEKVAWVIHRIMWFPDIDSVALIVAEADYLKFGLTVSNNIDDIMLDEPAVIDLGMIGEKDFGTPASAELVVMPYVHDFDTLPGGGIIIPPKPLYVAVKGISMASAVTVRARIYFTHKSLSADEYWELVEARRMVE